jgi:hypothetical protein
MQRIRRRGDCEDVMPNQQNTGYHEGSREYPSPEVRYSEPRGYQTPTAGNVHAEQGPHRELQVPARRHR